jgi:hypothetical protein
MTTKYLNIIAGNYSLIDRTDKKAHVFFHSTPLKGRAIRKVMGGGDFFNLYEYFFKFFACVDNFFKYNSLHKFFLFQLIIFPIEKSPREFFFQTFLVHEFFSFCFPCAIFFFAPPPPSLF